MRTRWFAVFSLGISVALLGSVSTARADDDSPMAKVQRIMAHSKEVQSKKRQAGEAQALSSSLARVVNPAQATQHLVTGGEQAQVLPPMAQQSSPVASTTPSSPPVWVAEKRAMEQRNLHFRERVAERITILKTQNAELKGKVTEMTKELGSLNDQIGQIRMAEYRRQTPGADQSLGGLPLSFRFSEWLKVYDLYIILGLALIILLLLIRRKSAVVVNNNVPAPAPTVDDTQGEYDFMGSREAVPVKLDLARAYLAMADFKSAHSVLAEVVKMGSAVQRQEAESLMTQLPG